MSNRKSTEPLNEYGYPVRHVTDKEGQIHAFGGLVDGVNSIGERYWRCSCGWTTSWYKTDRGLVRSAAQHLNHPVM
jgi:hypothetical protein